MSADPHVYALPDTPEARDDPRRYEAVDIIGGRGIAQGREVKRFMHSHYGKIAVPISA